MMMENQRGSLMDEDDGDRFPVGMRVLAVDDDRTCLKVLETMLRSCQYHVTTTTKSIKALEILRKNKNKFDLVISDVKMPDMDGFKLLEQVGLEMNLPVIMLSGHRDKKLVMKGVIHGACDYLLKPVRMEELQNIWQHVLRKKIDRKDKNKAASVEKACNMVGEGSQGIASENSADQIIKLGQKRKEQSVEEEEDDEEDESEDGEPSSHKKPRLVWAAELHRKFVAAVNQLGLENAVPKKILDLMNVEGLTRENVASHLQKFRLGIKKATQQANKVAVLGSSTDPYLQMGSVDGYRDFHTLPGSRRIPSTTLPSYASGGIFCGLNSPSGSSLGGISSSAQVQWWPVQSQNMNSSIKTVRNFHLSMLSANQSSSLLQAIPKSIELNRFQQSNCATGIRQLSPIDSSSGFTVSSGFPDCKPTIAKTNNSLSGLSSNHLLLQGNSPPTHSSGAFRNHSSLGAASVNTESFDTGICGSSNLLGYNESWQSESQLSNFPANSLPLSEALNSDQLPHDSLKFSSTCHIGNSPVDFSSTSAIAVPLEDDRGELQCQEGLLGNIVQVSSSTQQRSWEDHKQDYSKNMSNTFNSTSSMVSPNGDTSSLGHNLNQNDTVCSKRVDASLFGQENGVTPSITWCSEDGKLCSDARMKLNDACILQQMKSQEELIQNSFGYLDDIISEMAKQEQNRKMVTPLDHVSDSF